MHLQDLYWILSSLSTDNQQVQFIYYMSQTSAYQRHPSYRFPRDHTRDLCGGPAQSIDASAGGGVGTKAAGTDVGCTEVF